MRHESGFAIGLVLMAVVLIAAIAGIISLGLSSGASTSSREQSRVEASTVISQAVEISNIIQNASNYSFLPVELVSSSDDCSDGAGTCYPALTGGVVMPLVSKKSITTSNETWQLINSSISFNAGDLGTSNGDRVLYLNHMDQQVCQAINKSLYQTTDTFSASSSFPLGSGRLGGLSTGSTKTLSGCVQIDGTPPTYAYIHVVDVQ